MSIMHTTTFFFSRATTNGGRLAVAATVLAVVAGTASCAKRGEEPRASECLDTSGRLALTRIDGVDHTSGRLARTSESDDENNIVDASFFSGSPTVVVFWSVWCDTCDEALDDLERWVSSNAAFELNVVAINSDGEAERDAAIEHAQASNHSFGAYMVNDATHNELNERGYTPTVCVSGTDGSAALRFVGYSPENKRALLNVLDSFPTSSR